MFRIKKFLKVFFFFFVPIFFETNFVQLIVKFDGMMPIWIWVCISATLCHIDTMLFVSLSFAGSATYWSKISNYITLQVIVFWDFHQFSYRACLAPHCLCCAWPLNCCLQFNFYNISQYYCFYFYFWSNKCNLGGHKYFFMNKSCWL